MGPGYYLEIARMQGYGDPKKEALWAKCPEPERLAILRHLMSLRAVTENCQFVEELAVPEEEVPATLDKMVVEWSKKESLDEIPMTLAPFVFCAFSGAGFSLERLKREADRFLWMPEPLPDDTPRPRRPASSVVGFYDSNFDD